MTRLRKARRSALPIAALARATIFPLSAQTRDIHWKCLLLMGCLYPLCTADALVLTSDESAPPVSIVLPGSPDARTQQAARDLSAYLARMFHRPFPLRPSAGGSEIILGTAEEMPEFSAQLENTHPGAGEGYVIKSEPERLFLVGASSLGVQNAVWECLHRLGYRHYYPDKKWEIVPSPGTVDIRWNEVSFPSYATRSIVIGAGTWPELSRNYREWRRHNRLDYGFILHSSHEYGRIIARNREAFDRHPEYLSGPPEERKLVIAEPGLRKLVIADALSLVREHPERDSISMEPSDGPGWPESSPLGSVSDQVVTLANEVSTALQAEKPGIKVGILAYGEHSPPPSIQVHPDVIVTVATGFIRDGHTHEALMKAWARRGATLGVYDYYGVWAWDQDLPGKSKAASPGKVAADLLKFHRLGARYFFCEASDGWAPNGLGHYVAARCLWNVDESGKVDAILDEFFEKAFGPAKAPMRQFYLGIDGVSFPLLSDHLLGVMYRALEEAYALTADEAVISRIDDLAAYTRFVELFHRSQAAEPTERDQAKEALFAYAKSIRSLGVVHTRGMSSDRSRRDPDFQMPGASESVSESRPTHEDFRQWVAHGARHYVLRPFQPRAFSRDLVPLPGAKRPPAADRRETLQLRGANTLFTYIAPGEVIRFSVEGGGIHGNRGPVRIELFPILEPLGRAVAVEEVPADQREHEIVLSSRYEGLHRIELRDSNDLTILRWPTDLPLAIPSGQEHSTHLHRGHTLYFHVPKGTRTVAGYSENRSGEIIAPDGSMAYPFSRMAGPGYFEIPVPEGQDGGVWTIRQFRGKKLLMTVPSYLALSPESLLVPAETLE